VVPLGWFSKLWEASSILSPIKLAAVNDDTTDGGSMATDPFSSAVYDDIGTVCDGAAKEASSTECVVDLHT
jgi:hypothetical protein